MGLRLHERRRAAIEAVTAHVPLLDADRVGRGGSSDGGGGVVRILGASVRAGEVVDVSMCCDRNHGVREAATGSGGTHRRCDEWGRGGARESR